MELIILGAGGFGQTIADVADQLGRYDRIRFLDDKARGENILGTCGEFGDYVAPDTEFYPAFGDNQVRLTWLERLLRQDCRVATLIHPQAYVSPRASIGTGTVVLPKAAVNTGTKVGRGCILNMGALVDHGCELHDGVHVCLGAVIKAENQIPALTKVESGTVIERATCKGEK